MLHIFFTNLSQICSTKTKKRLLFKEYLRSTLQPDKSIDLTTCYLNTRKYFISLAPPETLFGQTHSLLTHGLKEKLNSQYEWTIKGLNGWICPRLPVPTPEGLFIQFKKLPLDWIGRSSDPSCYGLHLLQINHDGNGLQWRTGLL